MKNYKKCQVPTCRAISEYVFHGMHFCEYDFIRISNYEFSKNGNVKLSELMEALK